MSGGCRSSSIHHSVSFNEQWKPRGIFGGTVAEDVDPLFDFLAIVIVRSKFHVQLFFIIPVDLYAFLLRMHSNRLCGK